MTDLEIKLEAKLEAKETKLEAARNKVAELKDRLRAEKFRREMLRHRITELEIAVHTAREQEHRDLLDLVDPGDGRVFVESSDLAVA